MIRALTFLLFLLITISLRANNIIVSTPAVIVRDQAAANANPRPQDNVFFEFDVRWSNSWRYDDGVGVPVEPANHDAAWVFFKYRLTGGVWRHATLRDFGNSPGTGPTLPTIDILSDDGAMIYQSANGTGDVNFPNIQINWDYVGDTGGTNGDPQNVEVRVYAIEMVYIPTDNFFVGSGGPANTDFTTNPPSNPENLEVNEFYTYDANDLTSRLPFQILDESAITVGTTTGNMFYQNVNNRGGDRMSIPAGFPKGHNQFYLQKYETTQQQWVCFFNTLTDAQKINRDITAENGKDGDVIITRNAITWSGGSADANIVGGGGSESNIDREYVSIALNFVSQQDMLAYLDWAALRPMTELEFEKAARGGGNSSEANEYVWGSPRIGEEANDLSNSTRTTSREEVVGAFPPSPATPAIGIAQYIEVRSSSAQEQGPLRAGIFAGSDKPGGNPNTRFNTGAGFYGNMELSGNVLEGVVNVGRAQGRAFTNTNGDGEIDAAGNANVPTWPTTTEGLSVRGGAFDTEDILLHTSDRSLGVTFSTTRGHTDRRSNLQYRGVRGL